MLSNACRPFGGEDAKASGVTQPQKDVLSPVLARAKASLVLRIIVAPSPVSASWEAIPQAGSALITYFCLK